MAKSKSKNHLLQIEFYGPALETKSIPINDLGETLVAFQHIIYKCYLHEKGRLHTGAQLTHAERDALALQLDEHTKGSDIYSFVSFLTDPATTEVLTSIVVILVQILSAYATQKIEKLMKKRNRNLVSRVYPQVKGITIQISNNITKIEITPGKNGNDKIIIERGAHEYIKTLESKEYRGDERKICGFIIRLDPMENWVDIKTVHKKRIRVSLKKNRRYFRKIRLAKRDAVFEFTGVPLWKIGSDMEEIRRFEASKVTQLRKRKKKVTRKPPVSRSGG